MTRCFRSLTPFHNINISLLKWDNNAFLSLFKFPLIFQAIYYKLYHTHA